MRLLTLQQANDARAFYPTKTTNYKDIVKSAFWVQGTYMSMYDHMHLSYRHAQWRSIYTLVDITMACLMHHSLLLEHFLNKLTHKKWIVQEVQYVPHDAKGCTRNLSHFTLHMHGYWRLQMRRTAAQRDAIVRISRAPWLPSCMREQSLSNTTQAQLMRFGIDCNVPCTVVTLIDISNAATTQCEHSTQNKCLRWKTRGSVMVPWLDAIQL